MGQGLSFYSCRTRKVRWVRMKERSRHTLMFSLSTGRLSSWKLLCFRSGGCRPLAHEIYCMMRCISILVFPDLECFEPSLHRSRRRYACSPTETLARYAFGFQLVSTILVTPSISGTSRADACEEPRGMTTRVETSLVDVGRAFVVTTIFCRAASFGQHVTLSEACEYMSRYVRGGQRASCCCAARWSRWRRISLIEQVAIKRFVLGPFFFLSRLCAWICFVALFCLDLTSL